MIRLSYTKVVYDNCEPSFKQMNQKVRTRFLPSSGRRAISEKLKEMAVRSGPNAKLPTRRELCVTLGTSSRTIDDALNDLEARNVIYRRQGSGIYVSPRVHRKTIRILMDATLVESDCISPFWSLLWGLFGKVAKERAETHDEEVLFNLVNLTRYRDDLPLAEDFVHQIETGQLHGVVNIGLNFNTESMINMGFPLVVFAGDGHWHVTMLMSDLIELLVPALAASGATRIALWRPAHRAGHELMYDVAEVDLAKSLCQKYGIELLDELIQDFRHSDRSKLPGAQDQGYDLCMRTFGDPNSVKPDAILCCDDMMTDGALSAMHRLGLFPGRDIIVGTHTNRGSSLLHGYERDLILAEYDPIEIVRAIFAKLDILMSGELPDAPLTFVQPHLRMS